MAGLFHAIVLQRLGHTLRMLEKSPVSVLQSEATGLRAGPDVQRLIAKYIQPAKPYATTSSDVHVVNVRGAVPESAVSESTRRALENRVLMFRTERGYTVS
jgi:hypothetical protein